MNMAKFDPYEHLKISLNSNGTLSRHYQVQTVQPNPNPRQGEAVASKDVTLNPERKTWARIFRPSKLPSNDSRVAKLPMMLFFHSGGWICNSVADIFYHNKCAQIATSLPSIVVAVNYRLAPENRIPAQYEDAVDALLWVKQQGLDPKGEEWIRDYADFSRCYLIGRQCGANIVFNAALRALDLQLSPLKISGLILNQPMFSSEHRTKSELKHADDDLLPMPVLDLMWELALPKGTNKDHRYCNPMGNAYQKRILGQLERCLVIGYGGDPMFDKQQEFVNMLVSCGARVEAHFDDIGFHGIDLIDPKRSDHSMNLIRDFI